VSPIRNVAVLGATESTGSAALEIIRDEPDRLRNSVLAAAHDVETLVALSVIHRPDLVVIGQPELAVDLARRLRAAGVRCDVDAGHAAIQRAAGASVCDIVVSAMNDGLPSIDASLSAARAGKRVLLAHKESIVLAGSWLRHAARESGGEIIPLNPALYAIAHYVDRTSASHPRSPLQRLVLLSSGGAFVGRKRADLMTVTPDDANVSPGSGFSVPLDAVDAATQMSAGLDAIAIHQLFGVDVKEMELSLSAADTCAALVAHGDGSLQAVSRAPDMRSTIAWALNGNTCATLNPAAAPEPRRAMKPLDLETFRCPALALEALRAGGDAPVLLNAANEVAVSAFLAGTLPFLSIPDLIEQVLTELPPQPVVDTQTLSERDRAGRDAARRVLRSAC
jgi:1-deoxy-D-xylulose-5-phosphate reductoisomerase